MKRECEKEYKPNIAAVLFGENASAWSDTLSALATVPGLSAGCVYKAGEGGLSPAFSEALASIFDSGIDQLLIVTAPVIVPSGILDISSRWMLDDPRVATISFLTNGPGYLSFPVRNGSSIQHLPGATAESVTSKLRRLLPQQLPVHIAVPEGAVVLMSRTAFKSVVACDPSWDAYPTVSIAECAVRASRRGFLQYLDSQTFVLYPLDCVIEGYAKYRDEWGKLRQQQPFMSALYQFQQHSPSSALAVAMDCARAAYNGLRVLVDGSCLGPYETGTQVQTVALVKALAAHDTVQWVGLALSEPELPAYATDLLKCTKVRIYPDAGLDCLGCDTADIFHRPVQAGHNLPYDRWRQLSKRIVLTLLDLIAYRIGIYQPSPEHWLNYRASVAQSFEVSDGVVTISHDVLRSVLEERLCPSEERLFVVPLGIDHLTASEAEQTPLCILERGWVACNFVLVLGTDYSHKNRDLAIRVWRKLRDRGHCIRLVMAGTSVAYGSSRDAEHATGSIDEDVLLATEVSSAERTWLLRHASLVLYPSSAEGFGLVPFEAAVLGTPTVSVSYGPLREFGVADGNAGSWEPDTIADVAQQLLEDPIAASTAITNLLAHARHLTWAEAADKLVFVYFKLLSWPANVRLQAKSRNN